MAFKKNTLVLLSIVCLVSVANAQKVKYKDLFILLNAKQYKDAEPVLKRYLKENQDNPNAFLNMGYIYEDKANGNDVLKETEKLTSNIDSAILFFDKAYKTIDERELKKNDEYYQAFSRRDLRTGEFGLKLSDIQFDLEKRIKGLKERQTRVKDAKSKFLGTKRTYENSMSLFKSIADKYKDQREFYLRADDALATDLRRLERRYDSCLLWFNDYKIALQALGKTGYNPAIDPPRDIADFKKDGYSQVDFFQDILPVWDYKRWAGSRLEVIEKEIKPMADKLTSIDAELNALREKIRKDSVSVLNELNATAGKIKTAGLEKFDPRPFPMDVYALKISELVYGSELASTKVLRDSGDVVLQFKLIKRQIKLLNAIDSMGAIALARDVDYEAENYKGFVQMAYGSVADLKKTLKSTVDFAVTEKAAKEKRVKELEVRADWIIDQMDSIPVNASVKSVKFSPLAIVDNAFTYGFTYPDSITTNAYFYQIIPSHSVAAKASFKVDSANYFKKEKLPLLKGIGLGDADKKNFYVVLYSEEFVAGKVPAIIYKITPEGLAWSKFLRLEGTPLETSWGAQSELTIKITTTGGNKLVIIQPDGKLQG